jgi:hypothetical protein
VGFKLQVHLPVRYGRVSCPAKRGHIDPEACLSCPRLVNVTRRTRIEHVSCRPYAACNTRWSALR